MKILIGISIKLMGFVLFFSLTLPHPLNANPFEEVQILKPGDSTFNGKPILEIYPASDTIAKMVYELFKSSYMKESVQLYALALEMLLQQQKISKKEPAYLLLSQKQGGYARLGFYLLENDSLIDKSAVPYIELVKNNPGSEDYLGSMTQIYPHEMGHVIYRLLCTMSDTIVPASVDIHYSTLTTDYRMAFNEGFAMHYENMARMYDPDTARVATIMKDLESKKKSSASKIKSYVRDFTWPFRIGFFRMTMLAWYQNFEDIKRYEWITQNKTKYENRSMLFSKPEKSLFFRNSGIEHTDQLKVPQRAWATEGVIASFFTSLMQSEAIFFPYDSASPVHSNNLKGMNLSPALASQARLNQYKKIFHIIQHNLDFNITRQSQFLDFVNAYILRFPEEDKIIRKIFKQASGYELPHEPGNELWITNSGYDHGILVMEQFGGITLPIYTFNLNAATEADILTFEAIPTSAASLLVEHIRANGPLESYESLYTLSGLDSSVADLLYESRFHPDHLRKIEEDTVLSIDGFIYSILRQLLIFGGIYGLLALVLAWAFLRFQGIHLNAKSFVMSALRYLLFLFLALIVLVLSPIPALYFLGVSAFLLISISLLYKSREKRMIFLGTSIPALVVLLYNLI